MGELRGLCGDSILWAPEFAEVKPVTISNLSAHVISKITLSKGTANVHVILFTPNFCKIHITTLKKCFLEILTSAIHQTRTFVIFCDAVGTAPILANSRSSPQQISKLMRWFTTRYNLNSYYLDLTQVLKPNDWTPHFNLQISGQTKIGRAIARTVSGTPIEVFIYG
jgi:hypothetical protein